MSDGNASNMLWIMEKVWFGFGLKARKEVQRREVSVQFIGFEEERFGKMKKKERRIKKLEAERFIERRDLRRKDLDLMKVNGESKWVLIGFVNGDVRKKLRSDEISDMGEE